MTPRFGGVVIGAGVVGLAIARELATRLAPLLVIERAPRIMSGVSSRNSGVLHAGFHHPVGWGKSRLCIEGRRLLVDYLRERGLPHALCGKLIVAQDAEEEVQLEAILRRGREAGVEGLSLLSRAQLAALEPEVRGSAALSSEVSGIVDPHPLGEALRADAEEQGALVLCDAELRAAEAGYHLHLDDGGEEMTVEAPVVINAAGLDADRVASLFGLPADEDPQLRQRWVKGHYFRIAARHHGRVKRLVYPVPPRDLEGLGVHLTCELDGGLRLGPDTLECPREEDFSVPESLRAPFLRGARRFLPFLEEDDLSPDFAGFRPKLGVAGEAPSDFVIREESERGLPGLVTLCGIESPGLTATLAIARRVTALLGF